jgi:hypothetical protein
LGPTGADTLTNYSGDQATPAFPGEDFVTNAPEALAVDFPLDLAAGTTRVYITLDVQPASAERSILQFELLSGLVPTGAQARTSYLLENTAKEHLPAGLVVIR